MEGFETIIVTKHAAENARYLYDPPTRLLDFVRNLYGRSTLLATDRRGHYVFELEDGAHLIVERMDPWTVKVINVLAPGMAVDIRGWKSPYRGKAELKATPQQIARLAKRFTR